MDMKNEQQRQETSQEMRSGSSSNAEDDISDAQILKKLSSIHEDIEMLKDELKGEIKDFMS